MPFTDWPGPALAICALLSVLFLADAIRRADWQAPLRDHLVWASATALLWAARQMTVSLPGDLSLQYLGAAWLTVMLGYPRAIVTLSIVFAAEALAPSGVAQTMSQASGLAQSPDARQTLTLLLGQAPRLLLLGILPAWLIWQLARLCREKLPPNLFVFLLGVGFIGLFWSYALSLLLAAGLNWLLGGPAASAYVQTVLPYALLLSTGEAWLEGMMTTLLVVFAPGAVRLFDERHYLAPPKA